MYRRYGSKFQKTDETAISTDQWPKKLAKSEKKLLPNMQLIFNIHIHIKNAAERMEMISTAKVNLHKWDMSYMHI